MEKRILTINEWKKSLNESEVYHQNGGIVPQESEWMEVEDSEFDGKKHWAIKFNGEYYILNDVDFFKNNIGKSVSFKYKSEAKYPITIMPKVLVVKENIVPKSYTETELKQMSMKQLRDVLKDMGLNKNHDEINTHNPAQFYDTVNFIIKNQ